MGSLDSEPNDELLSPFLAAFDEALARGEPTGSVDDSPPGLTPEQAARLSSLKQCLATIDRVRRLETPPGVVGLQLPANGQSISLPANQLDDGSPRRMGAFRIERELGRGGLGIVFLAYDEQLARHVALKVPRPEALASPDLRKRFLREAEAVARFRHANLISVYEAGEDAGICYMAAEYCAGPTLAQWLREQSAPPPVRQAAELVLQLADAVEHAHGRGVLHRDIKPSNILLEPLDDASSRAADREGLTFRPKLTDFGMAKLLRQDSGETRTGAVLGTLAYMSPEQAEGRADRVDARTDVYSLGAILYELLTGASAHAGDTDAHRLRRLLFEEPVAPRALRSQVPRDLEAICLKCLEKSPARRYPTANALALDLSRFLAGRPTGARPLGPLKRSVKWARRRPAAAALVVVSFLAATTIIVGALESHRRLQRSLAAETRNRELAERETRHVRQISYSDQMRLAYAAYNARHVRQAKELLARQNPVEGQPDLREFSWRLLDGLTRQERAILRGHRGEVYGVAWSPDGETLASAGQDYTLRLWNARTGASERRLIGHTNEVIGVAFSPDGKRLASASEDGVVRLWNVASGRPVGSLHGHASHVMSVTFSPDGRWIATGERNGPIRVWDTAHDNVCKVLDQPQDDLTALRFLFDGQFLVACDNDGKSHLWRTSDWYYVAGPAIDKESMLCLSVCPERRWLATAGRLESIHIWLLETDRLTGVAELTGGHTERIQSIAFAPGGRWLASAGKEGAVQIWDLDRRQIVRTILGHDGRVWSVAWSPDAKSLATAGEDGTVRLWDTPGNEYVPRERGVRHLAFTPDGKTLFGLDDDGALCQWDTATGELLGSKKSTRSGGVFSLAPNGKWFAITRDSKSLAVRDLATDQERIHFAPSSAPVNQPAWSPDSRRLAHVVDDTNVEVVDVETGQVIRRVEHPTHVFGSLFSPDGKRLVTSTQAVRIVDLETGREVAQIPAESKPIYLPDGSRLVTVNGAAISFWDPETGLRNRQLVGSCSEVGELAIHPSGRTLAAIGRQPDAIVLWDLVTGQELASLPFPGTEFLYNITFSPTGDRLVASGREPSGPGRVWEWKVPDDKQLPTVQGATAGLSSSAEN